MYDYFQGEIVERLPTSVTVDCGGVGYRLLVSYHTFAELPPKGRVKLFAVLHVQEDDQRLYGFATREERQYFRLLQSVSGIGPSTAINILSGMTPARLREAIVGQNHAALKDVKGIGKKLAERIVLELRDTLTEKAGAATAAAMAGSGVGGTVLDAILALVALGYQRAAAEELVRKVEAERGAGLSVEDLLRFALRKS